MEEISNNEIIPESIVSSEEQELRTKEQDEVDTGEPEMSQIEVEKAHEETTPEETHEEMHEEIQEDAVSPQTSEMEQLTQKIDVLDRKFDEKVAYDTHKNALFDKMYDELSAYRNDMYKKIMKPIIMDTIMVLDDINKIIRDIDQSDAEKVFKVLSSIPDDLLDILERNGVEAYQDELDTFNPKTQRVLKTIPTTDPELNNKVKSRIRQGYKWDDKVIKPEMISLCAAVMGGGGI